MSICKWLFGKKEKEEVKKTLVSFFPNPDWTDAALKLVKASKLPQIKVSDDWFKNTPENWVHLLAAMTRFESNFKPQTKYKENFKNSKGEFVISTGLLQLSYESARGYGFKGITTEDLLDPVKNLEVGVKIMETLVLKDGTIAANGKSPYKGGARYWSVLRSYGKLEQVKSLYKSREEK